MFTCPGWLWSTLLWVVRFLGFPIVKRNGRRIRWIIRSKVAKGMNLWKASFSVLLNEKDAIFFEVTIDIMSVRKLAWTHFLATSKRLLVKIAFHWPGLFKKWPPKPKASLGALCILIVPSKTPEDFYNAWKILFFRFCRRGIFASSFFVLELESRLQE